MGTVAAIEAGDPAVSLGNVFHAADIVGPLSGAEDGTELARLRLEDETGWRCCPLGSTHLASRPSPTMTSDSDRTTSLRVDVAFRPSHTCGGGGGSSQSMHGGSRLSPSAANYGWPSTLVTVPAALGTPVTQPDELSSGEP